MFIIPRLFASGSGLEPDADRSVQNAIFLSYQLTARIANRWLRPFPGNFTFFLIYIGKLATTSSIEIGAVCVQQ
jgi:hypothetical protein